LRVPSTFSISVATVNGFCRKPAALRVARDVALGLGPEVDYPVARIRSRFTVRYCRDVVAKSRPLRRILVLEVVVLPRK
jgi:hypothetical protein